MVLFANPSSPRTRWFRAGPSFVRLEPAEPSRPMFRAGKDLFLSPWLLFSVTWGPKQGVEAAGVSRRSPCVDKNSEPGWVGLLLLIENGRGEEIWQGPHGTVPDAEPCWDPG